MKISLVYVFACTLSFERQHGEMYSLTNSLYTQKRFFLASVYACICYSNDGEAAATKKFWQVVTASSRVPI